MKLTLTILAAGMGSRYGGLKQIDPVGPHGEAILDYSIYDAKQAGFERVVFVIRSDIEDAFRSTVGRRFEQQIDVDYAFQRLDDVPDHWSVPPERQKPWGTAHAVRAARDAVDTPFAVINADDFYGRSSYQQLAEFLRQSAASGSRAAYALVGFVLRNTLSDHGHVSRGICTVDEAMHLRGVVERTHIVPTATGAAYEDEQGQSRPLTGDEWVSMNMWGFTPAFFAQLDEQFERFLAEQGQQPKAEFYIPAVVDQVQATGSATVEVLPSDARWFGVTYREDKSHVETAIREMVNAGVYPSLL